MRRYFICAVGLAASQVAHAQSTEPPKPTWTASASATNSKVDGQGGQPAVSLSLTHTFHKGYIGLSSTLTDTGNDQTLASTSPERIETVSLSAGRQVGSFTLEIHASAGRGIFKHSASAIAAAQDISVSKKATGYGFGGAVSTNLILAKNLVFTPRFGIDYSETRIIRNRFISGNLADGLKLKSNGVTLSGGGALQTRFGKSSQHGFALTATLVELENTSDFIHRGGRVSLVDIQSQSADTLLDYGASLSLALSRKVGMNFSATRSAGSSGSESTVLGAGLQMAF